MSEPSVAGIEGGAPGPEQQRRSQRPLRPLTHRMDLRAIRQSYFDAGLLQPELEPKRGSDRSIVKPKTASNQVRESESLTMHAETESTSTKPPVGGTQQQQHVAKITAEISPGQVALMSGATLVASGIVLMAAWKGMTRWLG